jgi:hypothetical protein
VEDRGNVPHPIRIRSRTRPPFRIDREHQDHATTTGDGVSSSMTICSTAWAGCPGVQGRWDLSNIICPVIRGGRSRSPATGRLHAQRDCFTTRFAHADASALRSTGHGEEASQVRRLYRSVNNVKLDAEYARTRAEMFGIPKATVQTRTYRAIAALVAVSRPVRT